jgi:hypothetical protein
MPPKGTNSGSRESEAYELLSRDTSLDVANGSTTLADGDGNDSTRHNIRRRFSQPQIEHGEESRSLLRRAAFGVAGRLHVTGGLAVSLELITQSTPSLFLSVIGSVMTGMVFDVVQFWPPFLRIGELFILVPVLLNLKGCLEMNLASRLSTSVSSFETFLTLGEYWRVRHQTYKKSYCYWQSGSVTSAGLANYI